MTDVDWGENAKRAARLLELRIHEPQLYFMSVAAEPGESCEERLARLVDLWLGMTDLASHLAHGLAEGLDRTPRDILQEIAGDGP